MCVGWATQQQCGQPAEDAPAQFGWVALLLAAAAGYMMGGGKSAPARRANPGTGRKR